MVSIDRSKAPSKRLNQKTSEHAFFSSTNVLFIPKKSLVKCQGRFKLKFEYELSLVGNIFEAKRFFITFYIENYVE